VETELRGTRQEQSSISCMEMKVNSVLSHRRRQEPKSRKFAVEGKKTSALSHLCDFLTRSTTTGGVTFARSGSVTAMLDRDSVPGGRIVSKKHMV
jgi:hypothetical protein